MSEEEMEMEMSEEDLFEEFSEQIHMANAETTDDTVIIRRELKYATFEYDESEKSITIETRSDEKQIHRNFIHCPDCEGDCKGHVESDEEYNERVAKLDHPINGRIKLNSVYSFALLRFVIRIAQRNWFRKVKK